MSLMLPNSLKLLFVICLFPLFLEAQVRIGIKTGANLSEMETNFRELYQDLAGEVGTSSKIGYHLGLFGDFPISDKAALRVEAMYSFEGVKLDGFSANIDGDLSYFNVPVALRLQFLPFLYIHGGVEAGFLVENDLNDVFDHTIDFSFITGGGLLFGDRFGLEVRYLHGITELANTISMFTDANGEPFGTQQAKSRMWQISLEIKLF